MRPPVYRLHGISLYGTDARRSASPRSRHRPQARGLALPEPDPVRRYNVSPGGSAQGRVVGLNGRSVSSATAPEPTDHHLPADERQGQSHRTAAERGWIEFASATTHGAAGQRPPTGPTSRPSWCPRERPRPARRGFGSRCRSPQRPYRLVQARSVAPRSCSTLHRPRPERQQFGQPLRASSCSRTDG